MKPPTFAPAYVGLFPILAEVAQANGYALAVHGSVSRDFDLVAFPWTESAVDAETLIRAMAYQVSYSFDSIAAPDMYQTHARLLDESQAWRSSGRNVTEVFQNRIVNAVAQRRLAEAMQQGVEVRRDGRQPN